MMTTQARARVARQAAQALCLGILLGAAWPSFAAGRGFQHGAGSRPAPAHARPQGPGRPQSRPQPRPQNHNPGQSNHTGPAQQPQGRPGTGYGQQGTVARPAYNPAPGGWPYSVHATPQAPGHLPQWMAQHQNLPVGQQERLLRAEPGFSRLNPGDQQRAVQQLREMNQMPEAQRQRRLARAENLERLSPAQRMQVNESARQLTALPTDRQARVRNAFRDLRGVPVDQRQTMLNSARYSSTFTPEERGILGNLLSVEPYEPPH